MTFKTTKTEAKELTKVMKTHKLVGMRVNADGNFVVDFSDGKTSNKIMTITREGVEEILKFGFASRSLFP